MARITTKDEDKKRRIPKSRRFLLLTILILLVFTPLRAQADSPAMPFCMSDVYHLPAPGFCTEMVVNNLDTQGIVSISALTFGPDGRLYFARPATRQIMAIVPQTDVFYHPAQVFADNLPEPPNGLTYADGFFYVSGDTTITRLDLNGKAAVIVSDLPGKSGGWLSNIHVGPDKRLYVAKGASCDTCLTQESDPRRGALLSFALDGTDPKIVVRGLQDSYDFAWDSDGTLYIADNQPVTMPAQLDKIAACHDQTDCTLKPFAAFGAGSHPMGVLFYNADTFPTLKDSILVTLAGSRDAPITSGYALMQVTLSGDKPLVSRLIPPATWRNDSDAAIALTSFFPYRPAAMAISPEGWIYIALQQGRIYRLRPPT